MRDLTPFFVILYSVNMSSRSFAIALAAFLALASSCSFRQREADASYVSEIIMDEDSRFNRLVTASSVPDPQGEILLIGPERECSRLADIFASIDVRDNVDGSYKPDGLPDFAGETIACIIDTTGRTERYLHAGAAGGNGSGESGRFILDSFRNALDTVIHVTPYDLEGIGHKRPAKLILSVDPFLTQVARHEVDTLFHALGSKVHVISPYDGIEAAVSGPAGGGDAVTAVMHDPVLAASAAYRQNFMLQDSGKGDISCITPPDTVANLFTAFLDDYIAAGHDKALNLLAVADFYADVQRLRDEYASTLSVLNKDSARYSGYLAKDFRIVGSVQTTMARCYDLMRADNLFSHRISKPQIVVYYCHPDPQDSDVSFLVPAHYVQN